MTIPREIPSRAAPTTPSATSTAERFRPDIQGLRAIAVGSVVLYHAGLGGFRGGYVGVDVFFVISGFLITTHLLNQVFAERPFSFASFYARRARRILPAAFAVNVLTLAAVAWLLSPLDVRTNVRDAIWTALYLPNLHFARQATDYLAQSGSPSAYQHFWSLGVEEQFYLLWPLLIVLTVWAARRSRRTLGVVLATVGIASFVACVRLTTTAQPWAFFSPWTRAWEFAVGGLVALALTGGRRLPRPLANGTQWLGLAGLGVAIFGYTDHTRFPGTAAALPVLATAGVILAGARATGAAGQVLGAAPMRFIGELSYSLYLVHWPVLTIARARHGGELPLTQRVVLVALCLPLAYALYQLIENPVRRSVLLAKLSPRRVLLGAGACTAAVVLLVTAIGGEVSGQAMSTNRTAAAPSITRNPVGTSYVPSNLQPALAAVASDNPKTYSDGCHLAAETTDAQTGCTFGSNGGAPMVALFGDSHAAEWFPALQKLADAGKIRLESFTKSGCPSVDTVVDYHSSTGPQSYPQCPTWRQNVVDRLSASPPALIVLSNYNDAEVPTGGRVSADAWSTGVAALVSRLPKASGVVMLGETPLPGSTPSECLARHLSDANSCDIARSTAIDTVKQSAERRAAQGAGARYVDLNAYFCNSSSCPVIVGNVQVYRDSQHISATYSALLADVVWQRIKGAMATDG
jgi:peptidoglycan/LPS O-acetylase OafA/YrhL